MEAEAQVNNTKVKIKEIRKALGLTQQEMADLLGLERTTLSKFENGKLRIIWIEKAIALQKLIAEKGYSLDDIAIPHDPNNSIAIEEN